MISSIKEFMGSFIRGSLLSIFVGLFLFLSSAACQTLKNQFIEPELRPYLTRFLHYCQIYNVDCYKAKSVNYYLEEIEPNALDKILGIDVSQVIGKCNYFTNNITIDKSWWNDMKKYGFYEDLETVAFHEFAHCILHKKHNEKDKWSIMYPTANPFGYAIHYQKIINELFSCKNECPKVEFTTGDYL